MLSRIPWSFLGIHDCGAFAIGRPAQQCTGRSFVKFHSVMAMKPKPSARQSQVVHSSRRRALARLRTGLDLQWTPASGRLPTLGMQFTTEGEERGDVTRESR